MSSIMTTICYLVGAWVALSVAFAFGLGALTRRPVRAVVPGIAPHRPRAIPDNRAKQLATRQRTSSATG